MNVKVLFFAHLRDVAGASEWSMEIPERSSIQTLADRLSERDIRFNGLLRYARPTVNAEWAEPDAVLAEDDEVGFLPPSSGG